VAELSCIAAVALHGGKIAEEMRRNRGEDERNSEDEQKRHKTPCFNYEKDTNTLIFNHKKTHALNILAFLTSAS
jgi:hypothetical protein